MLAKLTIYTTWTSHCGVKPYNGWLIAYSARTLKQTAALSFTPNGEEGAIWQSGAGPAADPEGNIYMMVANGTFDITVNSTRFLSHGDFGDSLLKISASRDRLYVADYFTMFNVEGQSASDGGLGSGEPLVLPEMRDAPGTTRHLVVGAGKDLSIYLLNRDAMGKFHGDRNDIYQELPKAMKHNFARPIPAYFNGGLYYASTEDTLRQYRLQNARPTPAPVFQPALKFIYPGATPSMSANGSRGAIVWVLENRNPAVLHAYDANDHNSNQAPARRDHFGSGNKFITPMIVTGKVYAGTPMVWEFLGC